MLRWTQGIAALLLGGMTATGALAQTPGAVRDPNMPDQKSVPAEKMRPDDPSTTGATGGTLSEKLNRSEGVITPPPTGDNEITAPAPVPNPNSTPVIRPPGTSPSDPVQPK